MQSQPNLGSHVTCDVRRVDGGFELVALTGGKAFLTKTSPTLPPLSATAAGWRVALVMDRYQDKRLIT